MYGPTVGDKVRLGDTDLIMKLKKIIQSMAKKINSEEAKQFATGWLSHRLQKEMKVCWIF